MTSTNAFAQELISKTNPIDGTVIITDDQRRGKGQGAGIWQSDPGKNVTCSVIYDTSFLEVKDQYFLNMAVAVAMVDAMAGYLSSDDLAIKWPNDILCNDRKLGGILIENSVQGRYLRYSVIGIGLNINQGSFQDLPHATSVLMETGRSTQLSAVLNTICESMEHLFLQLKAGKGKIILGRYNDMLYKRECSPTFSDHSGTFRAMVHSVDRQGRLVLGLNDVNKAFRFGEIKWQYESL